MRRATGVALVACVPIAAWTFHALGQLAHARHARDEVRAAAAPRLNAARALAASDAGAAARALARLLGDRASAAGVRLSLAPMRRPLPDGMVGMTMEARASEQRLDAFAAAVEAAQGPPVRLIAWSIESQGSGDLRLSAEAAAPWSPPLPSLHGARIAAIRLPDAAAPPIPTGRALFGGDAPADIRPGGDRPPELVGIAGRLGDGAVALLRGAGGSTNEARQGDTVAGWRVTRIDADRVRLARGREERMLVLPPR